ncbi:nuclear transport factor 2 family protein [Stenotrophomonas sp. ATCM1_4]|nr:nuclear transport factor 2 family protein [Stenotrophomonas sp. ATCM1_4]
MRVVLLGMLWVTGAASAAPDAATLQAIEATAHDYMDGQLEGDVARVTRALHPDLAKRNVVAHPNETLGLGRMSSDELIRYTREGALKTPRDQWQRSITVLAVDEDIATVRLESPWFIDHLQLGRFDGRWVIVNALWHRKKRG